MEDLPGVMNRELEVRSVAHNLTKELSNSPSVGVSRRDFGSLYQSFSELNSKLASRVETNITPECHNSDYPFDYEKPSRPRPSVSASARSRCHYNFCEDRHDALETTEGQIVGAVDRCCVCSTLASEEELVMTPCCLKAVGSICFEERLQETGKCCLCQANQPTSDSRCSAAALEGASGYKVHFITESYQDERGDEGKVGTAKTESLQSENRSSTGHAVAGDPPRLLEASEAQLASVIANEESGVLDRSRSFSIYERARAMEDGSKRLEHGNIVNLEELKKFSSDFKRRTPVPKHSIPLLAKNTAKKQNRNLVEDAQRKAPDPLASATTSSVASMKPHLPADSKEQNLQTEIRDDHLVTKLHILKLFDQDVKCYLKDVHKEDLLNLVHSALQERVNPMVCKKFFQQAEVLENGHVDLLICSNCSQDSDLKNGMKDWPRAFVSFVLTSQLRVYKVTVDHIQIGTMNILRGFEKSMTVQTLVNDNASVLKSLRAPADIRGIYWNKNVIGLRPIMYASITIKFSTAQQANETIEHGILWNHERRPCRRQGPHPRITQCLNCLAYGHIFKDCSSAPRCHFCAGMHLSTACTHDPATNKVCLKCALCGGAHDATSEECDSRKLERQGVQLENRFYPTGAENAEQGATASAA